MIGVTYIACPVCHRYTRNKATGSCENEHCAAHRPDSADKRPHTAPDWYSRALDAQPKNTLPPFPTSVQAARPAPIANPAPVKIAAPPLTVRPPVVAGVPSPPAPATPSPVAGESQARPARMHWRLVFLLAALGPMTKFLFSQDFVRDWAPAEWVLGLLIVLVIPCSCAGWIAKKAANRHFLHGLLVGFLFLAFLGLEPIYKTSQMDASEVAMNVLVKLVLSGCIIAGLYFGFFATITIRLVRREWWKAVKTALLFIAVFSTIAGAYRWQIVSWVSIPLKPSGLGAKHVTTESGLKYEDIVVGMGKSPKPGQEVTVHYTGTLENGVKFVSTVDRGQPFKFVIGVGQVIEGLDEGAVTMKVGGKRKLVIPPHLGYGDRGVGTAIPPNATIVYEVELLGIKGSYLYRR